MVLLVTGLLSSVVAAEPAPTAAGPKQRWQIGLIVEAPGACSGVLATAPVPMDWPEQEVAIVGQEVSPHVTSVRYRVLQGGVKQMLITIPQLPSGATATALVTFDVVKRDLPAPTDTAAWRLPARPSSELRPYLGVSPSIETNHPEIQRLAAEIVAGKASDWEKVLAIYDWVRANVQYKFDVELKGALTALKAGQGDCEELTSLFIALCRAQKIPARAVWVPGHCYPEFYLEPAAGPGRWFPCQAAGGHEFGQIREARPILQKGDNFKVPEKHTPQRYVAEHFQARNAVANPRIQWVQKQLAD